MEVVNLSQKPHLNALLEDLPPLSPDIDLIESSIYELDFLKMIDDRRHLYYNDEFIAKSIVRYENFWIPFLAEVSESPETDVEFIPPVDVHWVWHVHMLAPVVYRTDCIALIGRVIGHCLWPLEKMAILRDRTRRLWSEKYPGVPFDIEEASPSIDVSAPSKLTYDIKSAALRQGSFYYQVSLDHFRDPDFLLDALRRYRMYLFLKRLHTQTFLVPCYDIDLIWHTHQVHPESYARDTNAILGFVMKHDDSVNDRTEGSKLNRADEVTRKLWHDTFLVPFARPGSMFRGDPPQGKLMQLTPDFQRCLLAPREMDVELRCFRISATSVPDLRGHVKPMELILNVTIETESWSAIPPKKRSNSILRSLCRVLGDTEYSEEAQSRGFSLHIENSDGSPLARMTVNEKNRPRLMVKLATKSCCGKVKSALVNLFFNQWPLRVSGHVRGSSQFVQSSSVKERFR